MDLFLEVYVACFCLIGDHGQVLLYLLSFFCYTVAFSFFPCIYRIGVLAVDIQHEFILLGLMISCDSLFGLVFFFEIGQFEELDLENRVSNGPSRCASQAL